MKVECIACDQIKKCETIGDLDIELCEVCKKLWEENLIIENGERE